MSWVTPRATVHGAPTYTCVCCSSTADGLRLVRREVRLDQSTLGVRNLAVML